uniref:Uncharacterized protein n=1 Tax=Avena sativa TaxID=4498 RepID=A0ACD5UYX1_AVESA
MVAVAAGRRPVVSRRRSGCGAGQQQPQAQQQRMLAVAVAARVAAAKPATTEAALYGGGDDPCCVDFLVCLLRAMGVTPASTGPAQFKWAARPLRRKRSSPRGASAEGRRPEIGDAPARIAGNGACATASLYTMQGKKGVNQDAMVVVQNFGSKDGTIFCGVFDGHGPQGHLVSKRVRDILPMKLSANIGRDEYKEMSNSSVTNGTTEGGTAKPVVEDTGASLETVENGGYPEIFTSLRTSFLRAFYVMDRDLKSHKDIDCLFSGTTAVTVIKQGHDLIIGNLGDSRAILATRNEDNQLVAHQLTVDLKPSIPSEAARIRQRSGRVFSLPNEPEVTRVWLPKYNSPGLAMARAFGDFCLKNYGVISVPEVSYHRITEKDEFIVLATDGIWDVLTNADVVNIVSKATSEASAARLLVQSAHRTWRTRFPTSKVDDCAAVCLFFRTDATNKSCDVGTKDSANDAEPGSGRHSLSVKPSTVVPADLVTSLVLDCDSEPIAPTNLLKPTSTASDSMED